MGKREHVLEARLWPNEPSPDGPDSGNDRQLVAEPGLEGALASWLRGSSLLLVLVAVSLGGWVALRAAGAGASVWRSPQVLQALRTSAGLALAAAVGSVGLGVPSGLVLAGDALSSAWGGALRQVYRALAILPPLVFALLSLWVVTPWLAPVLPTVPPTWIAAGCLALLLAPRVALAIADCVEREAPAIERASLALGAEHRRRVWPMLWPTIRPNLLPLAVRASVRALGDTLVAAVAFGVLPFTEPPVAGSQVGTLSTELFGASAPKVGQSLAGGGSLDGDVAAVLAAVLLLLTTPLALCSARSAGRV